MISPRPISVSTLDVNEKELISLLISAFTSSLGDDDEQQTKNTNETDITRTVVQPFQYAICLFVI